MRRLLLLLLLVAAPAAAQVRLQIIHNAADPAAAAVDVYVNGALTLDDFAFRTATGFLDLPANTDVLVGIAPGASTGPGDVIYSETFNLPAGTYQVVASGVLTPASFAPNPDGRATAFDLLPLAGALETSPTGGTASFRVVHGATDAPTVDVRTGGAVLVNDAAYTDATGYISVPPASYPLRITTADGTYVTSFTADLSGAGGAAVTVLASGFLAPAANQNGAAFALLVVFADGDTAVLPATQAQARLQVIHNAADPALEEVDVYVNGDLLLDDFAFRTATPFIDVDAEVPLTVGIAPGTSTGAGDAVLTQTYTLAEGSTTQLIANGVLTPASFAANPDGRPTGAQLLVGASAREGSDGPGEWRVRAVHGATDAPTVSIQSFSAGVLLFPNVAYGDVGGYLPLAAGVYSLDVTVPTATVASFTADLSNPAGGAVTVLASGFLAPAANQNGEAFGLLAVFPDGTTALLPARPAKARLQVIHNAADPALEEVDVYVNGDLLLDDFAFRTATPFIDVDADVPLTVGIAPGTSTGAGDALLTETYTLPAGSTTQLIANGVLTPASFAANPDGRSTGAQLLVGASARETSDGAGEVRVRVVHGATDAPTVDIRSGGATLVPAAAYTDVTGYLALPPADYVIDVALAGGPIVASFSAPLAGAGGGAATVLASGFLAPAANQDGEAFGLLAVFPNGDALLLPAQPVSTDGGPEAGALALGAPAPNPLAADGRVRFSLAAPGRATLALFDALGRRVATLADGEFGTDVQEARLDRAGLAAGAYWLRLDTAEGSRTRALTVVR